MLAPCTAASSRALVVLVAALSSRPNLTKTTRVENDSNERKTVIA